jgi:hypothetical protein
MHVFAATQYQRMDRLNLPSPRPVGAWPRPACTTSTVDCARTHAKLHRIHYSANETVDDERIEATTKRWKNGASNKVFESETRENDR